MKRLFIVLFMFIFSFSITNSIYAFGKENNLNNQEQKAENRQIRAQVGDDVDDNSVKDKEDKSDKVKDAIKGKGVLISEQRRSEVANAVHKILEVADRNGGIGEQVRVIAQSQKQNHEEVEEKIEKIKERGNFAKFFIGSKYNEIEKAKELIKKDNEKINQLEELKSKIIDEEDKIKVTEQIETIKKAIIEVQKIIEDEEIYFSLFGWLAKIF